MEIFKENEEEKKSGWTRILLILNLIIWTIVLFIWFIFNGVVNAQTINMTNWAWKDSNGNWTFLNTGDTTSMIGPVQLSFNFNDAPGNNNGTVYFEADVTGSISTNDITTQWWTNPNPSTTGTISKNCTVTQVNYLTNHVRCQLNFTITNTSQNLNIILNFANGRPFSNATASGSTDYQPTNNATTSDIINQTIQISNQIIQSVQNAINNTTDVTGNIVYQMQQAITDATQTIIAKDKFCSEITRVYYGNDVGIDGNLDMNGNIIPNSAFYTSTDYTRVSKNQTYKYTRSNSGQSSAKMCFYDMNKQNVECKQFNTLTEISITTNQEGFLRVSYVKTSGQETEWKISGELCKDRLEWILENQNSNTDRIIDRLYQDHQEQLEQLSAVYTAINPDTTDFNNLENVENSLHTYTNVNLDSFDVDLDTDTNSWVWNTLTSLLNSSALVFGMVISILSVGLIKLILNR